MTEAVEQCDCPICVTERLFPEHESPSDRNPMIVGIDVSTKYIALGILPAMGKLDDISSFGFSIESKKQPQRCYEVAEKLGALLGVIDRSVDITSVAIESPVGFGGKLLPIVGAASAATGMATEWYTPSQWHSVLAKELTIPAGKAQLKERVHLALESYLPISPDFWESTNEDCRDALGIALAHRIETLLAVGELTDEDRDWLASHG
jgi:Holliday junction resolvasome RuvABC endonuclease subunit